VAIRCPYCRHTIRIKQAKPGRHHPSCPKCHRKFLVEVPRDPSDPFAVHPLGQVQDAQRPAAEAAEQAAETTACQPPDASSGESPDRAATTAADVDPTAFWEPTPEAGARLDGSPQGAALDETTDFEGGQLISTTPGSGREAQQPPPTAAPSPVAGADSRQPAVASDVPRALGGYRIIKELGHGAMGTVYLAEQTSLKRKVALKTIRRRAADDPAAIARFLREAYAAAKLSHPNVVQIYDLGEQQGIYYFSMEYVSGEPLSAVVARQGPLPPERAVRYIIQAARGLKFAHDHGLVHRDVKPANLLLSRDGVVKVADLGLVKSAAAEQAEGDEHLTQAEAIMGTPAYMAPEQADRVTDVDRRADIYSLGCTLFELLTGRPPFRGKGALDVIMKHQTHPVPRPDAIVPGIPKKLADIVVKMMAKRPEERYGDLGQVIEQLEQCVDQKAPARYRPTEAHVAMLRKCQAEFRAVPARTIRRAAILTFWIVCALGFLVGLVAGVGWLTAGAIAAAVLVPVTYFALAGSIERTYLFERVNELVYRATFRDWLTWTAALVLVLAALTVTGVLWIWGLTWALALLLACALYLLLDRPLGARRRTALAPVNQLLRQLRQRGVDESELHRFVAQCAGEHWEELFEALFGYEAKIAARKHFGRDARGRLQRRYAAWRDPIIAWINTQLAAKQAARQRRQLQQLDAETPQEAAALWTPLVELLSEPARFLLGCVLVAACALWMQQNGLLTMATDVPPAAPLPEGYPQPVTPLEHWLARLHQAQPLSVALLGPELSSWCDSVNVGIAGVLLMLSLFVPGVKIAWFLYPAAVVMAAGHSFGIPDVVSVPGVHLPALLAGLILAALGARFGRIDS